MIRVQDTWSFKLRSSKGAQKKKGKARMHNLIK